MRTIKFRGKQITTGKWLYGDLMHDNQSGCYIYPMDATELWAENKVIPETIGQFTGLRDKDGKEIYEGDIIYMDSWSPHKYEIKFIEAAFCLAFISGHSKGEFAGNIHYIHHAEHNQSKVIGNIHDNPELLH